MELTKQIEFAKISIKPNDPIVAIPYILFDHVDQNYIEFLSSFYNRLLIFHPTITKNEKVICGFVKLGFSTNQIAEFTDKTVHSIEVARTRLRNKMDINNTKISLIQYLDSM